MQNANAIIANDTVRYNKGRANNCKASETERDKIRLANLLQIGASRRLFKLPVIQKSSIVANDRTDDVPFHTAVAAVGIPLPLLPRRQNRNLTDAQWPLLIVAVAVVRHQTADHAAGTHYPGCGPANVDRALELGVSESKSESETVGLHGDILVR
jgi:hypothetical protein